MKKLVFEPLDIPYLARPSLLELSEADTVREIIKHNVRSAYRSYDPNFRQMKDICTGLADVELLKAALEPEKPPSAQTLGWLKSVYDVCERLYDVYGSEHSLWYAANRRPVEIIASTWFKNSIRGVRVVRGQARAQLINARKSLSFDRLTLEFLARWIIEYHIREDANIHGFDIVDFGVPHGENERRTRLFTDEMIEPMSLELFEHCIELFLGAIEAAGYASVPRDGERTVDLFRRAW